MPLSFVKKFFEREMSQEFNLENSVPIINQIKNQNIELKSNKELMSSKKVKLTTEFIDTYKNKSKLESDVPNLVKLIMELVNKIKH